MAALLTKRRNNADGRFLAGPKEVPEIGQCRVAALGKAMALVGGRRLALADLGSSASKVITWTEY
jgi:hypothetical protein